MFFGGFAVMMLGVQDVGMGGVGVMCRFCVVAGCVVLVGFAVMLGGVFAVLGRFNVVIVLFHCHRGLLII